MNKTNAMKIACDFVSIENLDAIVQVSQDLRRHRLSGPGEDVLQLHLTLWHAWNDLDTLSEPSKEEAPFACPIRLCEKSFLFRNALLHHL